MLETVVVAAFGIFNALRFVAYLPQIAAVARDRNGATAVSFVTWGLWAGANASTATYAGVVLSDWPLCVVSASNAFFCLVVIVMTIVKRVQYVRRTGEARASRPAPKDASMETMR